MITGCAPPPQAKWKKIEIRSTCIEERGCVPRSSLSARISTCVQSCAGRDPGYEMSASNSSVDVERAVDPERTDPSSLQPSNMIPVTLDVVEECPEKEGDDDTNGGIEIIVNPSAQADDSCESKEVIDHESECFMW